MAVVIVYRSYLLPRSETFIKSQILSYRKWQAVLLGRRLSNELDLVGLDARTLEPDSPGTLQRVLLRLRRWSGLAPDVTRLRCMAPNLLHAHFGMDGIDAYPIAKSLNVPLVVTLHGFDVNIHRDWWESGKGGLFMRSYPDKLVRLGKNSDVYFVAVSQAIKDKATTWGIPQDKVEVVYIGVDSQGFQRGDVPVSRRRRRVLFVGRLVEKKGCEFLLRAMAVTRAVLPDAELTVVGDGPERPKLQRIARELGIHVTFSGALASDDVKKEFDSARVFCLPSITAANGDAEGLPIVLLESQAKGVPVVTSARGMAEAIVDGKTGYCVQERDVSGLADALVKLLSDDALSEGMSEAGPAFVRNRFDIASRTLELESYYDRIVGVNVHHPGGHR